jgi:regulator of replication initiation timing
MPETDLHKRIEELESENHILRTENKRLREALGLPIEDVIQEQEIIAVEKENTTPEIVSSINKYSPPDEKINPKNSSRLASG